MNTLVVSGPRGKATTASKVTHRTVKRVVAFSRGSSFRSSHVAIGAAESAAVDLVPHAIAQFQREHPGVRFTVAVGTPHTMLSDLLEDRVDLILTHEEPGHHDVAVLAAAPKSFCALMRPDHPLANRPLLHLRDCQDYPIVLARLDRLDAETLKRMLERRWRALAPKKLLKEFEALKK